MLIYNIFLLSNILIGTLLVYIPFGKDKHRINIYLLITFIGLTLLGGLRGASVGTDTYDYIRIFNNIKNYNRLTKLFTLDIELGYVFLNKLIAVIGGNSQTILFVTSGIISFGFLYFIKNHSKNIVLSVFLLLTLYYYYASFNAIRQYIAISILINSYRYIKEKDFIGFIFIIILASLFHMSSLFFIPLYIIGLIKWDYLRVLILIGIFILVYFNLELIIDFGVKLFPKYQKYLGTDFFKGHTGIMYPIVNTTIFAFVTVVYFGKKGYLNMHLNILYVINILIVLITLFSSKIYFATRLSWYLTPFHLIIIPNFLNQITEKRFNQIALILIIAMGIGYHTYCLSANLHRIMPYIPFWENL